jgi:hypothetical protein
MEPLLIMGRPHSGDKPSTLEIFLLLHDVGLAPIVAHACAGSFKYYAAR